jgi:hypothetical protein
MAAECHGAPTEGEAAQIIGKFSQLESTFILIAQASSNMDMI